MDIKQRYFYTPPYNAFKIKSGRNSVNKMDVDAMFDEGKDWLHNYMAEYDDEQYARDIEYMRRMYPPMAREVLAAVQEECDKNEYEGSVMFDEYPDKIGMNSMIDRIYISVKHLENVYRPAMEEDDDVEAMDHCMSRRGNCNWLRDMISIVLFDEMHHRRRRYYKRRRRYY